MAEPVEMILIVRERFDYEPLSGRLFYRTGSRKGTYAVGALVTKGYRQLGINRKNYMVHRLIWIWCKQVIPEGQIDHKYGDKSDTRIQNLRDVSQQWNMQNRPKPLANNKSSGVLGVHWTSRNRTNPWAANIRVNGILKKIGYYATIEEASAAYQSAKKSFHPGYIPQ